MKQLKSEEAAEILSAGGMNMTKAEVELILEFIRKLAVIAINQCLENENCRFIHSCKY
jgi:hypothetical protein